ncbi:MAG: PD-(D/E)XK nuclease family protein [Patescibacteria group bacterium]|nr:PD-(D/E)XK nuclease family protein [Patescibacteria group bacterium]
MDVELEVSYSQIRTWRQCQQKYYYKYVENLEPRKKALQLVRGSIIHECIQEIAQGKPWEPVYDKVLGQQKRIFREELDVLGDLDDIRRIVKGYVRYWRDREQLNYIFVEKEFRMIPLTRRTALRMKVDGLATSSSHPGIWLVEHKSHKELPDEEVRLSDIQTITYAWGLIKLGYEVSGVLWDYIRTKAPVVPEQTKTGLSRRKNIDSTRGTYLAAIRALGLDPLDYSEMLDMLSGREDRFYRRVYLPLQKSMVEGVVRDTKRTSLQILAHRHKPVRTLSRECRFCEYYPLCMAELRGLDSDFIRRNEYQQRRKIDDGEEAQTQG